MTDNVFDTKNLGLLLNRVYSQLNIKQHKSQIWLPKLNIINMNLKTYFVNFFAVCEKINRNSAEIIKFIQKELGTTTSVNGENQLVIDGIYREKALEKIVSNYVEMYVKCKMCSSLETNIIKENRINMIKCDNCKALYSIKLD